MKTVLLIDDDPAFRSLVTDMLQQHGWNVLEAPDGEAGLRMALEHRPQVVLCDLLMPRCNGFQFCRAIHARRGSLPETKVIATSGSPYSIDRINALESGADEFLAKPVRPDELLGLLERVSGNRKAAEESTPLLERAGQTRIKFWGVRGSIPAPGPETVYYGGNTSCVEVRADGELIILDAGTGIRGLGHQLKKEFAGQPIRMTILISHTHWDHIQGFPFFAPAYDPQNKVRILAFEGPRKGLEATLAIQMESPYFPISMQQMPGNIEFEELKTMEFDIGPVHVKTAFMNHPGVCVGYRLFTAQGSIAYFPDNELFGMRREAAGNTSTDTALFARAQDDKLREFIQDADVVISDAQFDSREYPQYAGWGHSCADDVVKLSMRAGVKQLFLFHHDPDHTDQQIAQILETGRQIVADASGSMVVEAAREGMEVNLRPK